MRSKIEATEQKESKQNLELEVISEIEGNKTGRKQAIPRIGGIGGMT